MIEVKNLTKIYRLSKKQMAQMKVKNNKKEAAKNISFTAKEGEIYGLLGPNGREKRPLLDALLLY